MYPFIPLLIQLVFVFRSHCWNPCKVAFFQDNNDTETEVTTQHRMHPLRLRSCNYTPG